MIIKVGIDVVEIDRIAKAMQRSGFLERILTEQERKTCTTPARVAGRWAAKEAIAKAVDIRLAWHEVVILNDETRAPYAVIKSSSFDHRHRRVHISISHEKNIAAAVAVYEAI